MATFVKHSACVSCSSSDALAHYSDGSQYCFSCGYSSRRTRPAFPELSDKLDEDEQQLVLPYDCSHDFPEEVYNWIKPTTITIAELIKHDYYYSARAGGLLRVFWRIEMPGLGSTNEHSKSGQHSKRPGAILDAYEVRYFFRGSKKGGSAAGPKSKFRGSKENTYAFSSPNEEANLQRLKEHQRQCLVIVEDSLSSIRVGRHCTSMPLFGSSISNSKLVKAIKPFEEIIVWLDSDKFPQAQAISSRIKSLGKKSRVIYTEKDPKYVDDSEIKKLVGN